MHDRPLPIGYIEYQRAWVGVAPPEKDIVREGLVPWLMQEIKDQAAREHPGLVPYSSRLERTHDGAGVPHYTLYVGLAPPQPTAEPLDPRNLNAAEHRDQIGDPGRDNNIGAKETKF